MACRWVVVIVSIGAYFSFLWALMDTRQPAVRPPGLEPGTYGLKVRSSAIELEALGIPLYVGWLDGTRHARGTRTRNLRMPYRLARLRRDESRSLWCRGPRRRLAHILGSMMLCHLVISDQCPILVRQDDCYQFETVSLSKRVFAWCYDT